MEKVSPTAEAPTPPHHEIPDVTPEEVKSRREENEVKHGDEQNYEVIRELVVPDKYHVGKASLAIVVVQARREQHRWAVRAILDEKFKVPDRPDDEMLPKENPPDNPPIVLGGIWCQPEATADEVIKIADAWVRNSSVWVPRGSEIPPSDEAKDNFRQAVYLLRGN